MKNNFLRVVKMTAYYSFLGLILQAFMVNILLAGTVEGQNLRDVKVSVNVVNVTLEQAFKIIEQKTNFTFGYVKDEIPLDEKVTLNIDSESLYTLLERLAREYNLVFNRINDHITVKKSASQNVELVTMAESGTIQGKITDASNKEPLIGANILLKGTTIGAATNKDGFYKIENLAPGEYTIVVGYTGYAKKEEVFTVPAGKTVELNFSLSTSTYDLDEVVVTSNFGRREKRELANPVTVITGKELEGRNTSKSQDFLTFIPGIQSPDVTPSAVYSTVYLRGVGAGEGIQVYIDGVKVAYEHYIWAIINSENIEKIEVLRGPMASTLHGSGSTNGVINIITKKGINTPTQASLSYTYTTQNEKIRDNNTGWYTAEFGLRGGESNFGYNISAGHFTQYCPWSLPTQATDKVGPPVKQWHIDGSANVRYEDFLFTYTGGYANREYYPTGAPSMYKAAVDNGWANPKRFLAPDRKYNFMHNNSAIDIKHTTTNNWLNSLTIGYDRFVTTGNELPEFNQSSRSTYNVEDIIQYSARFVTDYVNDNDWIKDIKISSTGGIDYNYKDYKYFWDGFPLGTDFGREDFSGTPNSGGLTLNHQTLMGLFGEAIFGYRNNLFLTTGIRYEKTSGQGVNVGYLPMPRVGLTYVEEISDQFTLKPRISAGKSSRAPLYSQSNPSADGYVSNPELTPEYQSGWEAGFDLYWTDMLSFELTYFNQKVTDLITTQDIINPSGGTPLKKYVNLGNDVSNKGWELSVKLNMYPFQLQSTLTTVDSRVGDANVPNTTYVPGQRTESNPDKTFTTRLTYYVPDVLSLGGKGGSIVGEMKYTGSQYLTDYIPLYTNYFGGHYDPDYKTVKKDWPGYTIFNLFTNYDITNNILLRFSVYNLLNNQSVEPYANFIALRGREISFGVQLKI